LILFSDVHRGDNSWADDFAHNQNLFFFALEHYFKEGFTYIELGDGDELWENKRFTDVRLAHSHVFWQMSEFYRSGRLHMIYGNHDMERSDVSVVAETLDKYIDERTGEKKPLFPDIKIHEGIILRHTPSNGTIFLVHGHQGDPINDQYWKLARFLCRTIWRQAQLIGAHDPTSPAKNFRKRDTIEKRILEWVRARNQPTVIGHTHAPSFPAEGEAPFYNDGSCVHPRCITGIEIDHDELMLIKWWIRPDEDGRLYISREILAGPRQVSSLFSIGK
jgi:predicted phosphodiesterase